MKSGSTIAVAARVDVSCSCVVIDSLALCAACVCGGLMWRKLKFSSVTVDDVVAALTCLGSLEYQHMPTMLL